MKNITWRDPIPTICKLAVCSVCLAVAMLAGAPLNAAEPGPDAVDSNAAQTQTPRSESIRSEAIRPDTPRSETAGLQPTGPVLPPAAKQKIDFVRDIRPILTDHCIDCHGPDLQEGQLRLDARAVVRQGGRSGKLFDTGKSQASLLVRRLVKEAGAQRMPLDGDPLSDAQVGLIRAWIDQGAPWPEGVGANATSVGPHWSYVKPQRPELPDVQQRDWPRGAIDHFILARLESAGMAPSPPVDKARLLRRVYLDLVGLPPSPEEVDAFLADDSADAYERVVDALLASPHYGERWARSWLDAARYADSHGYQRDGHRSMWAYRDWVIAAMNRDMPFDQFTIEQIAGDLLPEATLEQKIATGFQRCTTVNVEAGVDQEENRVNQVIDRVNVTGTVWLGTTIECSQCHDHKYDPFDQRDYYRLFAYFNNTTVETALRGGNDTASLDFTGPRMELPLEGETQARKQRLQDQRGKLQRRLDQRAKQLRRQWEESSKALIEELQQRSDRWQALEVAAFHSQGGASHEVLPDRSVLVGGALPDKDLYTIVLQSDLQGITALKLEALTDDALPDQGPGRHEAPKPNFVLHEVEVHAAPSQAPQLAAVDTVSDGNGDVEPARGGDPGNGNNDGDNTDSGNSANGGNDREVTGKITDEARDNNAGPRVPLLRATADFSQDKWAAPGAIDGDPKTGWAINPRFGKPHHLILYAKEPFGFEGGTRLTIRLSQQYGGGRTIGRLRLSATTAASETIELPPELAAALTLPAEQRSDKQRAALQSYFLALDPQWSTMQERIAQLDKKLDAIESPTTLVMSEMDQPRETRIFQRGDFLTLGEPVEPGTPRTLHALHPDAPPNRLGLARWLVDAENPLVARVTVNRWWSEFFGHGLVDTLEDFGTQGDRPTHPRLLDHLAVEFMEHGWSRKHIHKRIVMSATYRQDARVSEALFEADPYNRLHARGPRFRLDAETIRDNALTVSGLLSRKQGGPPVYPPQPAGLWRVTGKVDNTYRTSEGEDRYRRGIYTVWRRSSPYPSFVNFDAPDRAACVVQRSRTNTPLQALTLLNDPVYVEMALALAERIHTGQPELTDEQRVEYGFRLVLVRRPLPEEMESLVAIYRGQLERFQQDPASAKRLLENMPGIETDNQAQRAGWFYVASILLNLDEAITKG
jgi:hypothetical protein